MNKEQLQSALEFLFEPNAVIGLELYLVIETENNGLQLRLADLGEDNLPTEVKNGFLQYVNGRTFENESTQVFPLSDLNSEKTTIHHYNLDGLPDGLEIINSELSPENIATFRFAVDKLTDIKAFLIKLSSVYNHIVLYKRHYHLNLLQQSKVFYFARDNERFAKPQEGILRFSFSVDFMKVNNQIMVYDISCLEKEFRFDRILINNAQQRVAEIAELNFVENIDELTAYVEDRSGAKKVLKIKRDSPVLALQFDQIKTFVQNHPYLNRRLRFNDDGTKFRFHTQVSKQYFIELLNDSFLTSDLTSIFYKTDTKSKMDAEQDENENDEN